MGNDCGQCEKVLKKIKKCDFELTTKSVSDIATEEDTDAMAQLQLQGMEVPIILLEGEFIFPADFLNPTAFFPEDYIK